MMQRIFLMTKSVNSINLIVGDWSHDGHSMTDTIAIKLENLCFQTRSNF